MIFRKGSVSVAVVARLYGKDANWVRAGIICGWLNIGTATRNGKQVTDISEMYMLTIHHKKRLQSGRNFQKSCKKRKIFAKY